MSLEDLSKGIELLALLKLLDKTVSVLSIKSERVGHLNKGDVVSVDLDHEIVELLQVEHGGFNDKMFECFHRYGIIIGFDGDTDARVSYPSGQKWTLNRIVLTKLVDAVTSGDHVELSSNEKKVKEMQEEHGGWNSEMEKELGKVGQVKDVRESGDIDVKFGQKTWRLNPHVVTKVVSADGQTVAIPNERERTHTKILELCQDVLVTLKEKNKFDDKTTVISVEVLFSAYKSEKHTEVIPDLLATLLINDVGIILTKMVSFWLNNNLNDGNLLAILLSKTLQLAMGISDKSIDIGKDLAEQGMVQVMLNFVSGKKHPDKLQKQAREELVHIAVQILLNMSYANGVADIFHRNGAVKIVSPLIKLDQVGTSLPSLLLLAYIVKPDQLNVIEDQGLLISALLSILEEFSSTNAKKVEGMSLSEVLRGMKQIARNASNASMMMQLGVVPLLIELMSKQDKEVKIEAANTIEALAAHMIVRTALQENHRLRQVLGRLPVDPCVQQAADMALLAVDKK